MRAVEAENYEELCNILWVPLSYIYFRAVFCPFCANVTERIENIESIQKNREFTGKESFSKDASQNKNR